MTDSQPRGRWTGPHSQSPEWRAGRGERRRAYQKAYYAKSDKAKRARAQANRHRLAKYGVDNEWVDRTLAAQGGCAICGTTKPPGKNSWHVDHDHKTGKVRGVLCAHCNPGLGHFRDSIRSLRLAIRYLELHADKQKQFKELL